MQKTRIFPLVRGAWEIKRKETNRNKTRHGTMGKNYKMNEKAESGMERVRVESGDIRTVGYDESVQTLEVEFHQGGTYQYYDVPKKIYDGFIKYALSHDDYHTRYIKNRYRHKKIR